MPGGFALQLSMQRRGKHCLKAEPTVLILVAAGVALLGCVWVSRDARAEAEPVPQTEPANLHTVTVKFDYDFAKSPSCTEKPALKTCVKQFNVYDVSGGRFRLFSIPVPNGATAAVKGITGQSPARIFLPGTHFIAVAAENAQGVESDLNSAKVSVEIKPKESVEGKALAK